MSFGYVVCGFGSHPSRGTPLAAQIIEDGSAPLVDFVEYPAPANSGSFTTGNGGIPIWDISVLATGGTGSYTYTWSNVELDDPQGVYSVSSAGTTNAARYNTLAITGIIPVSALDPPNDCVYDLICDIDDGVDTVQVTIQCSVIAIPL
jgi:hypothetical protein